MRIATFRFGVIADFVTHSSLAYGDKMRLVKEKTDRVWEIPGSDRTRLSQSTIMGWIASYKKAGYRFEGLMPKVRKDKGHYRKLDTTLRMAIKELKQENPTYTVPVIIKKLMHAKIIKPEEQVNTASIYRFINKENLSKAELTQTDRRRFEASFPNQIWQCDVMHGPSVKMESGPQKKAYLCAIMDDHSRLIIHAQFYLNETLDSLKDCLMQGMSKRGLPGKFYVDNGPCYRAVNLEQILASLGTALVHSRPYIPQGRGKIERWFRYVRQDFLTINADRPLALQSLNERLETWVDEYNANPHSSIKMSPYDKFRADLACIRPAPADLLSYFRKIEQRKVKKDRTVQLNTKIFEVPVSLIDKKVELHFHDTEPEVVEVFFEGRSHGMAVIMDPHVNSRIGRNYPPGTEPKAKSKTIEIEAPQPPIASGKLFSEEEVPNGE